jgi:hypothetical protein
MGFWPARRFQTLGELDRVYGSWRDQVAHRRQHATGQFIVADRLADERQALRPLPPQLLDFSLNRTVRVPTDGYLRHGACFYRAPVVLVHQRVELHASRDEVWSCWRGQQVARYPRSYRPGCWIPSRGCDPSRRPHQRPCRSLRSPPPPPESLMQDSLQTTRTLLTSTRPPERVRHVPATRRCNACHLLDDGLELVGLAPDISTDPAAPCHSRP